jgi:hypothetical protein
MRSVPVWLMVLSGCIYRESATGNAFPEKGRRQLHFRGLLTPTRWCRAACW